MRSTILAVPVVAAVVLLGGAACSAGNVTTSGRPASTSTTTGPTTDPTGVVPATSGPATAGGSGGPAPSAKPKIDSVKARTGSVAACRNDDVSATVISQSDRSSGTTRMAMVVVENTSKRDCEVDGWAAISLVNAEDSVVPVHTATVNEPGRPVRTTIKPGGGVYAGIKWTACDKADDSCGVGNTLRFNLQASTDGPVAQLEDFPAPETSGITMKNLRIGSLQPSRQGVVAW